MATIFLPSLLKNLIGTQAALTIEAQNVQSCLARLIEMHPRLKPYLFATTDEINPFVNVYVNNDDIRSLQDADTALKPNDKVTILLSMAGG